MLLLFLIGLAGTVSLRCARKQGFIAVGFVDDIFLLKMGDTSEQLLLDHGHALGIPQDQRINGFFLLVSQCTDALCCNRKLVTIFFRRNSVIC